MISRRRFLQGSLLTLGLAACGRRASGRLPRGDFPGLDVASGHRLREGRFPAEVSHEMRLKTLVLGAGVAGLSAAWKLERSKFGEVQVLDLEATPGGNSRAFDYPPSKAPLAAHYLPVPTRESRAVRELLVEMKLMEEVDAEPPQFDTVHLCHSPKERLYYKNRWHEGLFPLAVATPEERRQWDDFQATMQNWRATTDARGRRAFAIPLALSSLEPELLALDTISFADYAQQQGWTSPLLLWYLDYACRDDYGASSAQVSAWAGIHYFACRDGGGFEPADSLFVWPEGNQRLVAHLLDSLSSPVWGRRLVLEVEPGSPVRVDVLNLEQQRRERLLADSCIYALPTFQRFLHLHEEPRPEFVYPPWVTANLVMDQLPKEKDDLSLPAWDNVIQGSPSLGYVVATHQELRQSWRHPTVWTWYRPFAGEDPSQVRKRLLTQDLPFWQNQVLTDLAPLHPDLTERVQRLDVSLLGHAMIRPSVGFIWGQAAKQARRPLENLWFAHSDLSGISVFEEAQYRGVLAAQQLMAERKHPFVDSLLPAT